MNQPDPVASATPKLGTVYRKGYFGRDLFRRLTAKIQPVRIKDLPQEQKLAMLLGSPKAAKSLMEASDGDIRNLHNMELEMLAAIPHVGEGAAVRIAALFGLMFDMVSPLAVSAGEDSQARKVA